MITLCISGKATSGKTTAAQVICEEFLAESFAFGDGVKRVALELGWDGKKDARGRKLLQSIGRVGREYNSDLWVNKSIQEAKRLSPWNKDSICIFSDCRYTNEITRVKQEMYNVITMRIERDGVELLKDDSETSLDNYGNWDIVVKNNGSLEEFRSKIVEAVKCYLK